MQSGSLPKDLVEQLRRLGPDERVSLANVNHLALIDHVNMRVNMARRAARASRESFLQALDLIPDVDPQPEDRL